MESIFAISGVFLMILGVQEIAHNFRSKLLKFRSGWQLCIQYVRIDTTLELMQVRVVGKYTNNMVQEILINIKFITKVFLSQFY